MNASGVRTLRLSH